MIKLTIRTGNNTVSFPLNEATYFYGWNYPLKYEFISVLKKHFYRIDQSEYEHELLKTTNIMIDNQQLDLKKWKYYEISSNFSIENEFKLRSKSLMLKYFESALTDIEYEEIVSTINILFAELNEIITEKIIFENFGISIEAKVAELSLKNIIKLLELNLIKEEFLATGYNLEYKEIMLFQIKIAKTIAKINKLKNYIFIVYLPFIQKDIIVELNETIENAHFIIVNEHDSIDVERDKVIYFGNEITSFSDDVELYNKIMLEYGAITTLEELDKHLNEFLTKKDNKITTFLRENL